MRLTPERAGLSRGDSPPLTDPRTGTPRGGPPAAGPVEVAEGVAAAAAARPAWAGLTTAERSRRLLRLADSLEEAVEEYAAAERAGTGKPADAAREEVLAAADVVRFYAGAARAAQAPVAGGHLPGRESWVRYEPLGVVAAIVPWNYPLLMAAWRIAPALAAGNTVVLKPAETTPESALLLGEHAARTLGDSVLRVLPGGRDTGRLLVESAVDAVAFTGSVAGGLDVAARAGLRRVSLELGGNCAAVILPDAPPETYARLAAAAVYNAGQSCAAPERVITLRENYDAVVDRLVEAVADFHGGADFGPLNNPAQLARYDGILAASGAGGSFAGELRLLDGDHADGHWTPFRVLYDLEPDDPAVREETFGPCLTVQAADDVADAVRLANGVPQALAASVWGTAAHTLLSVAAALDAGEVWLNCHLDQTPELPHGGRRQSGHGTDLSTLALAEYQRFKTVTARLG
ncbi:aldehyde dehydrogenase family protein [Actinocorallia sp. API 0066]|uniref:aldehyde dehydrogenase family protein n=1 Tax=Actinocorallia sp. API 0066 TaxID=2896846 RepID=UPI001E4F8CFB|nr:aldehyde dehydrogenase family protein [Actinocorallia sp. API 0066]MCD0451614.1 aldehyde dehydrogenase family protein [Actinocorallia sp. API 0066]